MLLFSERMFPCGIGKIYTRLLPITSEIKGNNFIYPRPARGKVEVIA
jgi:hypothetical protein